MDQHFNQKKTQIYMDRLKNVYLKKDISHKALAKFIFNEYDGVTRIQILHLVSGIATADGILTAEEMNILKEISMVMRIPFRTFESILGMFHFRKAWERKQYQRKKVKRSTYSLDLAYQILGIQKTASVKEIKKAYRKLAILHHPDKVVHLGEELQKSAKEKFQKILDAYEFIKDSKGFS